MDNSQSPLLTALYARDYTDDDINREIRCTANRTVRGRDRDLCEEVSSAVWWAVLTGQNPEPAAYFRPWVNVVTRFQMYTILRGRRAFAPEEALRAVAADESPVDDRNDLPDLPARLDRLAKAQPLHVERFLEVERLKRFGGPPEKGALYRLVAERLSENRRVDAESVRKSWEKIRDLLGEDE